MTSTITKEQVETALLDLIDECKTHYARCAIEGCRYKELCDRMTLWESRYPKDIEIAKDGIIQE